MVHKMTPQDPLELQKKIELLSKQMSDLSEILQTQISRIWALEQKLNKMPLDAKEEPKKDSSPTESHVKSTVPPAEEMNKPILAPTPIQPVPIKPSSVPVIPIPSVKKIKSESESFDLETEIGGNWLSKIGIVLLFLSLVFFFKYALDQGWINEVTRVILGVLTGLILLFLGEFYHQKNKYIPFARTMTGGGLAVLYLATYAAYGYYHLIDREPAFIVMALMTVVAMFFSIRYDQPVIAAIGVMGGFITPVLLRTPVPHFVELLIYCFILTAGIYAVAALKNWQPIAILGSIGAFFLPLLASPPNDLFVELLTYSFSLSVVMILVAYIKNWRIISVIGTVYGLALPFLCLPSYDYHSEFFPYLVAINIVVILSTYSRVWEFSVPIAFILTNLLIGYWGTKYYSKSLLFETEYYLVGFFILYNFGFGLRSIFKKEKLLESIIAFYMLNAAVYFITTYVLIQPDYPKWPGYISLILVGFYLLFAWIINKLNNSEKIFQYTLVSLATVFATVSIPILLEKEWITIGWSVEAVILTWLGLKGNVNFLRKASLILLALIVVRLGFYDRIDILYGNKEFTPVFNQRFMAFLSGILSTYAVLYLLYKSKEIVSQMERTMIPLGLMVLGNLLTLWLLSMEILDFIDIHWRSWDFSSEKRQDLWMLKQLALSSVWAGYSVILVMLGMYKRVRVLRIFALILFGITIMKVFFVDLDNLERFYRIISFFGLGLILIGVSLMYNRFREKWIAFLKVDESVTGLK